MEDTRKPKWWIVATAAVLAVLTLFYYTGSWVTVVLFLAAIAAFIMFQRLRAARPASNVCLRCGAPLNPNARQCDNCGSASWTIRTN
jgi:ribosomal protein L40E